MTDRIAVVLFNLGGPDSLSAIRPFLRNMFSDEAIIKGNAVFRALIARVISTCHAPMARKVYQKLGGSSPLLKMTLEQASALETKLNDGGLSARCFIAMRYWHPLSEETAREVIAWAPEKIILLPLYPQYSGTTTGSSLKEWKRVVGEMNCSIPTKAIRCYPTEPGWIATQVSLIEEALSAVVTHQVPFHLLFSAHGLPESIIAAGDPYQSQIKATVEAIFAGLKRPDLDNTLCYQGRVGPGKWLGPSVREEIERAGRAGRGLIVVPVSFVSEHSETLIELDDEYGTFARESGVPYFFRVATVGVKAPFIDGLAKMVFRALSDDPPTRSVEGGYDGTDIIEC